MATGLRFDARTAPWAGLGRNVRGAKSSMEVLRAAGLDWQVRQEPVMAANSKVIMPHLLANIRETDNMPLGTVSDTYEVVQNAEAFSFIDDMLGEGVTYDTVGAIRDGQAVWILAHLPNDRMIGGDATKTWLCFTNSFDKSLSLRVAIVPLRIACQNMMNFVRNATRSWATRHTGDIMSKVQDARETLQFAERYMDNLAEDARVLQNISVDEKRFRIILDQVYPLREGAADKAVENAGLRTDEILFRWREAPDLAGKPFDGLRAMNALSDYEGHRIPSRRTPFYGENLFRGMVLRENTVLQKAHDLILK